MRRNVCFGFDVNVLGAVEVGRAAGSNAICTKALNSLFFESLVSREVVEIVRSKIRDGATVCQL